MSLLGVWNKNVGISNYFRTSSWALQSNKHTKPGMKQPGYLNTSDKSRFKGLLSQTERRPPFAVRFFLGDFPATWLIDPTVFLTGGHNTKVSRLAMKDPRSCLWKDGFHVAFTTMSRFHHPTGIPTGNVKHVKTIPHCEKKMWWLRDGLWNCFTHTIHLEWYGKVMVYQRKFMVVPLFQTKPRIQPYMDVWWFR